MAEDLDEYEADLRAELEALALEQQLVASVQKITTNMRTMAETMAKQLEVARLQHDRLEQLERRIAELGHG